MGPFGAACASGFLRIIPHKTGVRVNAMTPESTMETAMVMENSR